MFERIPGQRAVKFGSSIYPDPDNFDYEEILSRFGVSLSFLFEDGVMVTYPPELEPNETPGDVSLYSVKDRSRILTITESFGCLEIYGPENLRRSTLEEDNKDPLCTIKILDNYNDLPILTKEEMMNRILGIDTDNLEDEEEEND